MWKYILHGVVLPERALISLKSPLFLPSYKIIEPQIVGDVYISIYNNKITVDFTSLEQVRDKQTLKNLMTELVSAIIDCAGVQYAIGYLVDLHSLYSVQEGTSEVFGVNAPGVLAIQDGESKIVDIGIFLTHVLVAGSDEEAFKLSLLKSAVGDFRDAILRPKDTAFFCYRAIESLIKLFYFKQTGKKLRKDKKPGAIEQLEKTLNLDKLCIEKIRKLNGDVRHGEIVWINGEDRTTALKLTRMTILRLLEYLNTQPPAIPSFTLLTL